MECKRFGTLSINYANFYYIWKEILKMILIRKYDKNGSSTKYEFDSKVKALLWLNDHLKESEWCWIMYEKENKLCE